MSDGDATRARMEIQRVAAVQERPDNSPCGFARVHSRLIVNMGGPGADIRDCTRLV